MLEEAAVVGNVGFALAVGNHMHITVHEKTILILVMADYTTNNGSYSIWRYLQNDNILNNAKKKNHALSSAVSCLSMLNLVVFFCFMKIITLKICYYDLRKT